jgi:hypothetical protein
MGTPPTHQVCQTDHQEAIPLPLLNLDTATMSDPPAPANMGTPFASRSLVQVWVGPTTISLYPAVNPSMQPPECAHAFHINKTALSAQNINLWLQLDALGMQLNLSGTVNGTINDWFHFFYDSWFFFQADYSDLPQL